jgi:hypothetical protein
MSREGSLDGSVVANMPTFIFRAGTRAASDDWSQDGEKITAPEKLVAIRAVLEKDGPVLVQHKFLRGGRGPATVAFDDFEDFEAYLIDNARAGDQITVWSLWPFMRDSPPLAHGKCPDADGAIPKGGAY